MAQPTYKDIKRGEKFDRKKVCRILKRSYSAAYKTMKSHEKEMEKIKKQRRRKEAKKELDPVSPNEKILILQNLWH